MNKLYLFLLLAGLPFLLPAQINISVSNPEAAAILLGDFDPADYLPATIIDDPEVIAAGLLSSIRPDSLFSYLQTMESFENRNTASDTLSDAFGIGAARRWAFEQFQSFSPRLIPTYLDFQQNVCGVLYHRNILAVLPGTGPNYQEVVLVEGHLDSRCEDGCDINCSAQGMEDNGSGSALVLELARVMSQYTFDRSIVFMLTVGEEQGLYGANAMAKYCSENEVQLTSVFNNDIVGGIICGQTASPPGCPGLNDIDSLNVRIYSAFTQNSKHKALARFTKLEYLENIYDLAPVKTEINIMTPEDRTGRGGDHMPFRSYGFPAIRFTSANEHGDGNPSGGAYEDRQHSMEDILGLDTDNDGLLDSFFVDFNYLARNTVINGNAIAMAALGPIPPAGFDMTPVNGGFAVVIDDPNNYGLYRIGARLFGENYWDTVYTLTQPVDTIYGLAEGTFYALQAATVDEYGVESLFSVEKTDLFSTTGNQSIPVAVPTVTLLQNYPNPFDEATVIGVHVTAPIRYGEAVILVANTAGSQLAKLPIELKPGLNEVVYDYRYHRYMPGTYYYSLVIDGEVSETKMMIYAY